MLPMFEHDCDDCIYLGPDSSNTMDLYMCPFEILGPTVIARRSSEPHKYVSGIVFANRGPLKEALDKALALGHIKRKDPSSTKLCESAFTSNRRTNHG